MLITPKEREDIKELKQNPLNFYECPICKKSFQIGIEYAIKEKAHDKKVFPYPHVHLHGNPLHGMICYLDSHLRVRSIGSIESIEISRDSETLNQVMKKWANPS